MLPENIHNINFRIAQIQTHSFCNAKCIMCPYETTRKVKDQGWMEWELFTKVVDDLIGYPSLKHIVLMLQNEPLLDDRLVDEVKYIRAKNRTLISGYQQMDHV